jgi:hypothetical protein
MLLISVSMKLIMYNMAHDERFSQYHAGLLCCGITVRNATPVLLFNCAAIVESIALDELCIRTHIL